MTTLLQDLRYGLRLLRKAPGFTTVAILTLALGIGLDTTIFGTLRPLLFAQPPVREPGQIANLWAINLRSGIERERASFPEFQDIREHSVSFESVTAYEDVQVRLRGESATLRLPGKKVTADFFRLLGADAVLGRVIQTGDDARGADPIAVISHGLWERNFGADPQVLGRTIWLDGNGHVVVGVMPRDFWFPDRGTEVWLPLIPQQQDLQRARRKLMLIGRLKSGFSIEQARAELITLAQRFERENPDTSTGWSFRPVLRREEQTKRTGLGIAFLFLPVFFVLLIACVNVTNLLLARAAARRREIAMRAALGADRSRLLQQFLTESGLLAAMAGAFGVLLAFWGMCLVRTLVLSHVPGIAESVRMDFRVVGFALFLCMLTPLLFGLAPALQGSRLDLAGALKSGGQGGGVSRKQRREREWLVGLEVALVVVLLIPTGLFLRTLSVFQRIDFGFDAEHVLTLPMEFSEDDYPDAQQVHALVREIVERVGAIPGAQATSAADQFPAALGSRQIIDPVQLEEGPGQAVDSGLSASATSVFPGYFAALGLRVARGRDFTDADSAGAPPIAVVSETAALRFWPGRDPLGQRFRLAASGARAPWLTVVGVVSDVRVRASRGPSVPEASPAQVYLSLAQRGERSAYLTVRTRYDPAALIPAVKDAIRTVDRRLPVAELKTVRQSVKEQLSQSATIVGMLGVFAGLALVLAAVGVYGVVNFLASQRTHEMGVRMALGAQRRQVFQLVLWQGMQPTLGGLAAGLAGGYALARLIAREIAQLGVQPTDPTTYSAAALVILTVAFLACYLPARRAMRVEPMAALRYE